MYPPAQDTEATQRVQKNRKESVLRLEGLVELNEL